jgi:hypothetical protein
MDVTFSVGKFHKPKNFGPSILNPVLYHEDGTKFIGAQYSDFVWKDSNDGFRINLKIAKTIDNGRVVIQQIPSEDFPFAPIFFPMGHGMMYSIEEEFIVQNIDIKESAILSLAMEAAPAVKKTLAVATQASADPSAPHKEQL